MLRDKINTLMEIRQVIAELFEKDMDGIIEAIIYLDHIVQGLIDEELDELDEMAEYYDKGVH